MVSVSESSLGLHFREQQPREQAWGKTPGWEHELHGSSCCRHHRPAAQTEDRRSSSPLQEGKPPEDDSFKKSTGAAAVKGRLYPQARWIDMPSRLLKPVKRRRREPNRHYREAIQRLCRDIEKRLKGKETLYYVTSRDCSTIRGKA